MQNNRLWLACALSMVVATSVFASDAGTVAQLVHEPDTASLEQGILKALRSNDARTRAAGARVATVRNVTTALNALRSAVDREWDTDAARELARAVVIMGGVREIDRAVAASTRLGKRLHLDVALAAARIGPPSIDHYFTTFKNFEVSAPRYFARALWGHPEKVTPLASRLLENKDAGGLWSLYLVTSDEKRELIDAAVLARAASSADSEIAADALWYVLERAVSRGTKIDPQVRQAVASIPATQGDPSLLVGAELVRRVSGEQPRDSAALRAAIGGDRGVAVHLVLGPKKMLTYLTEAERRSFRYRIEEESALEDPLPFALPSSMPVGLADAVLRTNNCSSGWLGTSHVTVDRTGRVSRVDLANVNTTEPCRKALDTLLKLSLAQNSAITAPMESRVVPLVRSPKARPCFDELSSEIMSEYVMGAFTFRPPQLRNAVAPVYPAGASRKAATVEVQVIVSETGCVRTARVAGAGQGAAMNDEALLAVSQWIFEPASVNTTPIEFPTTVQVQFKP